MQLTEANFRKLSAKATHPRMTGGDEAKGNMEPLQLAADAEQAALAVGVAGAVRQEAGVDGRPDADGLAHAPGHLRGDLFVAEVGVDDKHRVHLFREKAVNDDLRIAVAEHHARGMDAAQVDKRKCFHK